MEQEIRKVAVVGAGILGTQIAILAASFRYDVSAFDIDPESFRRSGEHQTIIEGFGEKAYGAA